MRTQLLAFMGLALLFFQYRRGGDAQQAWWILATLWPVVKTVQVFLLPFFVGGKKGKKKEEGGKKKKEEEEEEEEEEEKEKEEKKAKVVARQQGEWATYWAFFLLLLFLEHGFMTYVRPSPLFSSVFGLVEGGKGGDEEDRYVCVRFFDSAL